MSKKYLGLLLICSAALVACGKPETPAAAAAPAAEAPAVVATAAAPEAENTVGKSVYGKTCSMCHASGAAGAPKPGNKDEWGPRIAQGSDTLHKHAIEGFKGVMPARGGNAALTDDEVKAAVDYMVSLSK